MSVVTAKKTDEKGYNEFYKGHELDGLGSREEFAQHFASELKPFCQGGVTKGYVRGLATESLISAAKQTGKEPGEIVVLDAGCGLGGLSAYLGLQGFNVVGIDISTEARAACDSLANQLGLKDSCTFHASSLEDIPLDDASVDFVIGHASLHHFIKYEAVPSELHRVLRTGGQGFFADSFGENKLFGIFHNKEEMERLGDVKLTKDMIERYFRDLNPTIVPTDWFVMLDKLYLKILPQAAKPLLRKLSSLHFWLDRKISTRSRTALALTGAVMTTISKR